MKNTQFSTLTGRNHGYLPVILVLLLLTPLFTTNSRAQVGHSPIIGHWDLTVSMGDHQAASWLEVKLSGFKTLVGHFVGDGGSARPIAKIDFENGRIVFTIPPQWEMGNNDMVFEGTLENDKLTGTITDSYGKQHAFTGERAPTLVREKPPVWGGPIKVFNGENLDGWHALGKTNQWIVEDGVLRSPKSGSNIATDQKFMDFKLHIEFRYPAESNSGVYLRGRYEVQVIDSKGEEPSSVLLGGVYGFLTPNEDAALSPGEWQTYDITLIGRRVTIVANGKTIICDETIPGVTGGALDSKEGEPGPIYLQGDHGPIEYRNIVITPAK